MMYKNALLVFMLLLTAASAFTLEFSLRPGGFVFFPARPGNKAADGNETAVNGASVGLGEVRTRLFWGTTLGFDPNIWNFSYLVSRGYPILAWQ